MPRKYQEYTEDDLINAVRDGKSLSDVCRSIGIKPVGGNITTIKRKIQKLDLNIDHFTSQGWNRGLQLKELGNYSKPYKIKQHLAKKRGWKCELYQNTTWLHKPIPLECHHIDKDRTNNAEDNLQLLCRNCHFAIHDKK